jgi:hypothetical protein
MPNIILTDEELQEVDALLAEFDPERYPDTARLLEGLGDEDRQVLCTLVRESQRTALEIGLGMRAVVDKVETTGTKVKTLELDPLSSMEDGWMNVLTCIDEIHPLYDRAIEIMASISDTAWDPFSWACVAPTDKFSRLEDIYTQRALS